MFSRYQIGLNTYKRGNPFVPFPFPSPIWHWSRKDGSLVMLYPLFPWQKYWWADFGGGEWKKRYGPFFVSRKGLR